MGMKMTTPEQYRLLKISLDTGRLSRQLGLYDGGRIQRRHYLPCPLTDPGGEYDRGTGGFSNVQPMPTFYLILHDLSTPQIPVFLVEPVKNFQFAGHADIQSAE